jgi:Ni,Fe-hydrogenase maturation factor
MATDFCSGNRQYNSKGRSVFIIVLAVFIMKIVCLGNEFIEGDSLAKEVGEMLSDEYEIVNVKDSFELMGIVSSGEPFIILDVVQGLSEVKMLRVEDLRVDGIVSAHDFDAGFVLKLVGEEVRIIGLPMKGDVGEICGEVLGLIGEGEF